MNSIAKTPTTGQDPFRCGDIGDPEFLIDTANLAAALEMQAPKIEAEVLTSYCTACSWALLFIHQTWIGHNGSETCAPGGSKHIAAPNRDAAVARIVNKYGVDLSDWITTPEHPRHAHAVACVEICRIQLEKISTDGWSHPYVKAYSIALDVAIAHFLPQA